MAWNGSDSEKVEGQGQQRNGKFLSSTSTRNFNYKALCASLIVILVGGLAAWLMRGRARTPSAPQTEETVKPARIAVVAPHLSTNATKETATTPKERPPQHVGEIRDGFILLSTGELYPVKSVITVSCERVSLEDRSFDRFSDRLIGSVLRTEPGEGLLGSSEELFEGFDKEFEESLAYPIEIKEQIPADMSANYTQYLEQLGFKPKEWVPYEVACMEAWAPQPTNDLQKTIWDKVYAPPKNPMKIEFDPKKGR